MNWESMKPIISVSNSASMSWSISFQGFRSSSDIWKTKRFGIVVGDTEFWLERITPMEIRSNFGAEFTAKRKMIANGVAHMGVQIFYILLRSSEISSTST